MTCEDGCAVEIRKKIHRRNLAACKRPKFGKAQNESPTGLCPSTAHKCIVNVAIEVEILHQVSVGIGRHLSAVVGVGQVGAL